MRILMALALTASFTAGNFIYQALRDHEWGVALERSYFQAVAVILTVLVLGW